jgi:ABC-type polar amino acid transport system ATPase subunit
MSETERNIRPIIKVRGLHKVFDTLHVIKGVDLDVLPGEAVVIMGPSGGGKTVFLRCLNFLEEPSAGTIEIDGVKIQARGPARQRRRAIQDLRRQAVMVFQEFNLFPHMTVLQNIIEGAVTVKGVPREQAIAKAQKLLIWMDLLDKQDAYPAQLAGGQQQQVAIARSLCLEPKIILFDDPTSALDPESTAVVVDLMARLADQGMTLVIVSHEVQLVRDLADRVVVMANGQWVEIAAPEELLAHPQAECTRRLLARIL